MEFWFSEFHTPDVKHSIRVNKQLYSKQSDYQRIDIFETPEFGRVLTLDGNVMLTERDEFIYDEMIVHVPMAVHREAKDILVIGAGDGGVVRELTRYDRVERIDLVEMDPQVVEACRAYLPGKGGIVVGYIQFNPSAVIHSLPRTSTVAAVRRAPPPKPGWQAPPRPQKGKCRSAAGWPPSECPHGIHCRTPALQSHPKCHRSLLCMPYRFSCQ